jgi:DTW domain-containing protein YfiP
MFCSLRIKDFQIDLDPINDNGWAASMKHQRQRKTKNPCLGCGLHCILCICEMIPTIAVRSKLCLVIHHKELKRTTNTGMLAVRSLTNSEVRVRGENTMTRLDLSDLLTANYRTLLLFPSEDAIELNEDFVRTVSAPIQLIVPDGNWRQASKVHGRHPELQNITKVKISVQNAAKNHLRTEHFQEGMSTLEAIAWAMNMIEGPEVSEPLFKLYQAKLKQTLIGRGIKSI